MARAPKASQSPALMAPHPSLNPTTSSSTQPYISSSPRVSAAAAMSSAARRPLKGRRWVKDWVPQELLMAGGKCSLYKWVREDELVALKDKHKEPGANEDVESEAATEVLFLCTFDGCGKFFVDAGALRRHSHIHGVRHHVCHFEGCGKKFMDSSKLKRHFLIHTGERNFVCTFEGCGKAFSLDFNLKAHMKTHLPENYHPCPYMDCGRRFTQDCKLRAHIRTQHQKNGGATPAAIRTPLGENNLVAPPTKASATPASDGFVDRPYVCPYVGCDKAYIHEYKLNLHLRKEHPGHASEAGDEGRLVSKSSANKSTKRSTPKSAPKMPPAKILKRDEFSKSPSPVAAGNAYEERWACRRSGSSSSDSEETEEEDRDNGRGYAELSEDDDETDED